MQHNHASEVVDQNRSPVLNHADFQSVETIFQKISILYF